MFLHVKGIMPPKGYLKDEMRYVLDIVPATLYGLIHVFPSRKSPESQDKKRNNYHILSLSNNLLLPNVLLLSNNKNISVSQKRQTFL